MESLLKIIDKLASGKKSVAELGCGNGELINRIASRYPCLTRIVGVDLYSKPVSFDPRVAFVKQDLEDLRLEGKFDLVILNHVFEHIKDPLGLAKRIKGTLSDGGRLLIVVPNRRGFDNEAKTYLPEHGRHYFIWDKESLEFSLRQIGYVSRFYNLHFTSSRGIFLKYLPALFRIENPNLICVAMPERDI
jgi:SAM-dependent methyltransferase